MGSLNPVSRMHGFGETFLFHFSAPLLDQIVAQSHDQSPPSALGTRALFLYRTAITLIAPLDAEVLGSHIAIFDAATLRAEFTLGTNRLAFVDINMEPIAIVRSLVRVGTRRP